MKKIWIVFGLAAVFSAVTAQSDEESFADYWQSDYDNEWYNDQIEKLGILEDGKKQQNVEDQNNESAEAVDNAENVNKSEPDQDVSEVNADEKVQEEIKQFLEEPNKVSNDYQIEDNRPDLDYEDSDTHNNDKGSQEVEEVHASEEIAINEKSSELTGHNVVEDLILNEDPDETVPGNENEFSNSDASAESIPDDQKVNIPDETVEGDKVEDEIVAEFDINEEVSGEIDTKPEIVDTDQDNSSNDNPDEQSIPAVSDEATIPETIKETEQIVAEETDNFDSTDKKDDELSQFYDSLELEDVDEEVSEEISDKQIDDLFDHLFHSDADTFDSNDMENTQNAAVDEIAQDNDQSNDDTFNTPVAMNQDNQSSEVNQLNENESSQTVEEVNIDYDTVDKVYSDMKEDFNKLFETINKLTESSESDAKNEDTEIEDTKNEDTKNEDTKVDIPAYEEAENRPYNEENILRLREKQNTEEELIEEDAKETNDTPAETKKEKNLFETEVTSAELNDLMVQFALDHGDDLDVQSAQFDKNVAIVTIQLTQEPTVVTSPNYPSPYPTNNIIDWLFECDGMGIELNITDFSVNGFLGDYLLVKPGGIDESGHDGLIFSYNLNTERRYRFLDVNRMFVRFEARPGMAFTRGFSFSVRMISPPSTNEETEGTPETAPIIDEPSETLLIYIAGVVPSQFANITEEFRTIVADMATLYLNRAGDNIGELTTQQVTQITQTASCNINWPGFERCTAVRLGIPLDLADDERYRMSEDDLRDMWSTLVNEDPFQARMRRLGIAEFAVPNEESTMLVWIVISLGVVISAAMLGLALWRWSCIEDYTRMPSYSDTDSVFSEKKKPLELYPAPHQSLPALYDDDFVKYDYDTTRVDLGGYTNQSYARDANVYDIDSDDDLRALPTTKRDRFQSDV